MKRELDYRFRTSVSREGYENKETARLCLCSKTAKAIGRVKMAFKEQEVTVDEFLDYAVKGHAFCNLFKFDENKKYWVKSGLLRYTQTYPVYRRGINKGYFKLTFKSDTYFHGSQTIFVDVDFTHFDSLEDYISCLTYTPTCAYYSYSDGVDKNGVISRRFRLVYVFDSVLSMEQFKKITFALYDNIVADTNEQMYDMCGCSFSQYMNGSNSTETFKSNIIYSMDDFVMECEETVSEELVVESKPEKKCVSFSEELLNDMQFKPYEFVVRKWFAKGLRYITRTELDFGDSFYVTTTDDFVQLKYIMSKVGDGCQRRKKLYIRAALRRLMKDGISADELLYNLFIDRYKYFDNADDVITIDVLQTKVKAALLTSMDKIREMAADEKPAFVISSTVTDKHAAVAEARKEITNNLIGSMYDMSATIKANKISMEKAGYKVSLSRLYKWCNEFNVTPVKPIERKKVEIHGYNPELSIRENMRVMGCTMHQVLRAKKEYQVA